MAASTSCFEHKPICSVDGQASTRALFEIPICSVLQADDIWFSHGCHFNSWRLGGFSSYHFIKRASIANAINMLPSLRQISIDVQCDQQSSGKEHETTTSFGLCLPVTADVMQEVEEGACKTLFPGHRKMTINASSRNLVSGSCELYSEGSNNFPSAGLIDANRKQQYL